MSESSRPIPMPRRDPQGNDRLDSWKEIAAYLGREVRTVQLWEKNEGLPIHRHQHARQGSVYAFRKELDAWREARKNLPESAEPVAAPDPPPRSTNRGRILWITGPLTAALVIGGFFLWRTRNARPSGAAPTSVVVLPFVDFSPQKDQEYFSDGLTEEIIDALSRVPNLRVVARTSAFAFKGKPADIREIGHELNVDSVLEGSVRRSGNELRITAQLNRVSDGTHLWSRTFDQTPRDIFTVQREIAQSIADQLRAGQVPRREPTTDFEAYNLYQEARYLFNQGTPESCQKAVDRYQKAIDRDPKFALAYAGLADAEAYLAELMTIAPDTVMPRAREAAQKAVALDDNLAEGHTSLGIVKLDYELDREGAQREFKRAMELNPGSGYLHHWYAHSLEAQGRLEEALREMRASLDLDPLAVIIHWDIANEYLMMHRNDESLRFLAKSLELFPNHPLLLYFQAWAYHAKGDIPAAHHSVESFRTAVAGDPPLPFYRIVYGIEAAWDGRDKDARNILASLERDHNSVYVEPMLTAALCSALKDRDCLHRWLRRAYDEHDTLFVYLPEMTGDIIPAGDPEVKKLIAKIH